MLETKIELTLISLMIMRKISYCSFVLSNQNQVVPSKFKKHKHYEKKKEKKNLEQKFLFTSLSSEVRYGLECLNKSNHRFEHRDVFPQKRYKVSNHQPI